MPLSGIVFTLIVVGVLLWFASQSIPMDGKIRSILNIVVVVAVIGWLLNGFDVLGHMEGIRLPEGT